MKADDLFPDKVVAKGKNVSVTRSQLDAAVVGVRSRAMQMGRQIPPEQLPIIQRQLLDRLILIQILNSKATDADKSSGKEMADAKFAEVKTQAGTDKALDQQLKSMGLTQEQFRAKMLEDAVAEAVLRRELKVNVSDADAKKFYDDNPAKFEQPEMVRASHILLMTIDPTTRAELSEAQKAAKHKQIEDLLKRARDGEDFAKLAKENSEDPGAKDTGGEYTFGRGRMVPEFESGRLFPEDERD